MRNGSSSFVCLAIGAVLLGCGDRGASGARASEGAPAIPTTSRYLPRTREITITTVPMLVKEQSAVLPFLRSDFAKGGVLDGKEVYAFSPSAVTVVEGDTIHFTLINPEDDVHSFVLPDLAVPMPPQKVTTSTYIAKHAGIYPFVCSVASHLPMMWGQLVVLSSAAVQ
jgi:plastocyanin